jgi:hypothetical protein
VGDRDLKSRPKSTCLWSIPPIGPADSRYVASSAQMFEGAAGRWMSSEVIEWIEGGGGQADAALGAVYGQVTSGFQWANMPAGL